MYGKYSSELYICVEYLCGIRESGDMWLSKVISSEIVGNTCCLSLSLSHTHTHTYIHITHTYIHAESKNQEICGYQSSFIKSCGKHVLSLSLSHTHTHTYTHTHTRTYTHSNSSCIPATSRGHLAGAIFP